MADAHGSRLVLRREARRPRPRRSASAAVGVLLLLAGLIVSVGTSAPATAHAPDVPLGVEWFTGSVADFYVVPDPLPAGGAGDLIRLMPVAETATHVTLRIMYHSRDAADVDRAVTGTLTYPKAAAPDGGWPVISTANGTVGMGGQCALSRHRTSAPTWGLPVVAVATDYIGMGPVGERHPYLSRISEGNSVIDAVRAARNLPAAGASTRWLAIGGSQGGHGALSANELGAERAPELDLLGSVALAPGAMFDRTYGGLDPFIQRVLSTMGLYGAATEYPQIDPDHYVTPAAAAASAVFDTGCLTEITVALLGVPFDGFWTHDPLQTEPARSIFLANDVGHVRVASPVMVVQGTADTTVLPARTHDLVDRMCGVGQVLEYLEVAGADHGTIGGQASSQIRAWVEGRLRGDPAPDTCPERVITPAAGTVVEGDDGVVELHVPVSLSRPSTTPVTVSWFSGVVPDLPSHPQAEPGVDYTAGHGKETFSPGQTELTVVLRVDGDDLPEDDELIVVAFGGPVGARMGGFWGLGFGTIVDDD